MFIFTNTHIIHSHSQWIGAEVLGLESSDLRTRVCSFCDGEIVFVVIKSDMLSCYWFDVMKISWRYLETQGLPDKGWSDFKGNDRIYFLKLACI